MPPSRLRPPIGSAAQKFRATRYDPLARQRSRSPNTRDRRTRDPTRPTTPSPQPRACTSLHVSNTQPPNRQTHEDKIQAVLARSVAKRTSNNYTSAVNAFQAFCKASDFTALPAEEFTLSAYAAHLAFSYAGSSIANAFSAIKSWHDANAKPWNGSPRLRLLLKGATNGAPPSSKAPIRTPVTTHMLNILKTHLRNDSSEDLAILTAALVAFWGLLRLGELLGTSSRRHNPGASPSIHSIGPALSINGSRTLHLPCTKTSQINGESIVITAQADPLNPISTLNRHLEHIACVPASSNLFTFIHAKSGQQKILTKEHFLMRCNKIWSDAGIPKTTGHAFASAAPPTC